MHEPTSLPPTRLAELASWLELRIHEEEPWGTAARLYGITVLDGDLLGRNADEAARYTLLAEGPVYDLLDSPTAVMATMFDAIGLCCHGTATRLDIGGRFRCRTVLAADEGGHVAVNRVEGMTPEVMGAATGPVAERMNRLFDILRSAEPHRPA